MPAPTSTWTTLNTADYTADSPLKEGKLLLILQDTQYLYDNLVAAAANNYWQIFEQRLQSGSAGGGPFG